jgi:CRISPR-associated protein Csx3
MTQGSSSYHLKLEGEVLRVGFNRSLPAQGDTVVRDALQELLRMIGSEEIAGGSRILIDGPQTVAVAYAIAHKLAHLYSVVAVLDPKIGKKDYKTYIVTISHNPEYQVGDLIQTKESQPQRSIIKVVLCGPPHAGKSCLREGLKQVIFSTLNAPYPYVITACPDGEGSWFQKAYELNPEWANEIRKYLRAEFTPEVAKELAIRVESANQLINIIDVGGKISPENEIIMKPATHAVILSGDINQFAEWEQFCQKLGLKVVAKIHSQLEAEKDEVFVVKNWQENTDELLKKAPLLTGSVHRLERGENLAQREMVKALAQVLIDLTRC